MAYERNSFLPIPQAPKYEMNKQGVIRNRKTRQIIRWQMRGTSKLVTLHTSSGKQVCVTYPSLMWLLFGECVGKKAAIPVSISQGNRQHYFPSCRVVPRLRNLPFRPA